MATSSGPGSASSTEGSWLRAEGPTAPGAAQPLDLDALPSASEAAAKALERERPGGLPYADYFLFLKQFEPAEEALRAIPLTDGPRFTLD